MRGKSLQMRTSRTKALMAWAETASSLERDLTYDDLMHGLWDDATRPAQLSTLQNCVEHLGTYLK